MKRCIANVAYIMLFFPIVIGIIAFVMAEPLLNLLKTPANIMADSLLYVRVMCVGLLFVSLYNYVSSMLRALGDSRTPLYFLIFACVLNTVLDIIFVKNLHMNVFGAGVATVIAQLVSGVACMVYAIRYNSFFQLNRNDLKLDMEMIKASIRMGIPLSFQFSMIAISVMAMQRVVNTFGATTVAAFTATGRIEQLIQQPYQTLGSALTTYAG